MRSTISALARIASRGKRAPPELPPTAYPSALASSSSASASTSINPLSSSSAPSAIPEASEGNLREERWYHVNRSDNGQLPVYSKIRNGGGITTIVRKVDGDVRTLQTQLNTYLSELHIDPFTHPAKVTVRPTNNHLQIKGHWVNEVKGWLEGRGF